MGLQHLTHKPRDQAELAAKLQRHPLGNLVSFDVRRNGHIRGGFLVCFQRIRIQLNGAFRTSYTDLSSSTACSQPYGFAHGRSQGRAAIPRSAEKRGLGPVASLEES